MKTVLGILGRINGLPLVAALVLCMTLGSIHCAEAAVQRFYINPDSGTLIPGGAGTTNLTPGNTSNLSNALALLSTTAPTAADNNTRMQLTIPKNTANQTLGMAILYYDANPPTRGFGSNAVISANATGDFWVRAQNLADIDFEAILRVYNATTGAYTDIGTSGLFSATSTSGPRLAHVTFNNPTYTLQAGYYLAVLIRASNTNNNSGNRDRTAYVYCNSNNQDNNNAYVQSRINAEVTFNISSLVAPDTDYNVKGTITPHGATNPVDAFSNQNIVIASLSGNNIQSLLVDGSLVSAAVGQTNYTYPFTNINKSHTISVAFATATATFNIAPGTGGYIDLGPPYLPLGSPRWPGQGSYTYSNVAGTYPFTVTPNAGYVIDWVRLDGVDQPVPLNSTTTYSLNVNIATVNTLSAAFRPYISVTSSAGTGGTISPVGTTPVLSGGSITFAIIPDSGYRLLSITDNGVNAGNTSPYTITNVTVPHDVVATFLRTYTLTGISGPNGSINPVGDVIVDSGGSRNYSMTPSLGYRINDVLVDGTSVGAVTSYTFTNVAADHRIEALFVEAPIPSTYCAVPPYINTPAPPSVMLMMSVESPMEGAANPTVTCGGATTASGLDYNCSSSGLGAYDDQKNYYGYFENNKCYTYSGSGATGLFSPSAAAVGTYSHQCTAGTAWSGNMLNWSTMLAVDAFRKAFTGGNRDTDIPKGDATYPNGRTIIKSAINDGSWFPVRPTISNAELYMPVSGTNVTRTIKREGAGIGFGVCNAGQNDCTVSTSGSGENKWPTAGTNTAAVYSLRILTCDSTGGTETRCNSTNNKPEGTLQKNMDKMRFALMSYTGESGTSRDGGVLRTNMKWISAKIPTGLKYHSSTGAIATCSTTTGCDNPEKEINTDGTFVTSVNSYPEGSLSGFKSGVINYINKFAYTSGYRGNDPMGELYYQVVRYFRNQNPTGSNCSSISNSTTAADGFNYYCASGKTTPVAAAGQWRDPAIYPCSQNYVIAINDANPWTDKRVPGSAFKANYRNGGSAIDGSNDYCGSGATACDTDFLDNGVQVDVEGWTNAIGDWEGLTGTTMNVACEVNSSGLCIGGNSAGKNVVISKLGRIIGTPPYPAKENSYNVSGLAYYAHMTDLRPDLGGSRKHNLTTYMIDTQEPGGSMLVGPRNMLFLAAKYGGFLDKDSDGKPFKNATCAVGSSSPNSLCSEWDDDNEGTPDNYFFASDSSKVESGLNKAFASILNRATSGTAAAVANNRSGERGANVLQAVFYPSWPKDKSILWLGDLQALWFYIDPLVQYSNVYEDSDMNKELNLDQDRAPGADSLQVKALWKAGEVLLARSASTRTVYTLLDTTQPLTAAENRFLTSNRTTLKPLLDMAAASDTTADAIINYVLGVDSGAYRSRTLSLNSVTGTWKLGDIINSTPQIQGSEPLNSFATDYSDSSYAKFTGTVQYMSNNYTYVGSNDGMLHAFRLGQIEPITSTNKFRIARIVDDADLGKEDWAFIPKNVLPYLKNCADANYCHQYLVDGSPLVFDASINAYPNADPADPTNRPGCTGDYWNCKRRTAVDSSNNLLGSSTSWRTILLGSMGHGGATRDGNCNETLSHDADATNNTDCIKTPVAGNGYSSYFALDITTPLSPKFMWEFSDAVLPVADRGLGLTTPGPALVRINPKTGSPPKPDKSANGRWFAVFASGPTGPIDQSTMQMKGYSDQNLKLYVVDINPFNASTTNFVKCTTVGQANCNYWVFDSGIKYAFSQTLYRSTIDLDRQNSLLDGNYSDDVVYVTYNKASLDQPNPLLPQYPTAWDKGGVLRLVTNNDPDPANWFVSTLIDDIGPVTSNVDILQNRTDKKLWVFFGEGRFFFTGDDLSTSRRIFGVADPCYRNDMTSPNTFFSTAATCPALTVAELSNQDTINPADLVGKKGWYIDLTPASGSSGAERLYSKVSADVNGIVMFPTFTPSTDICSSGGTSSLWAVKYNTGGAPPATGLKGKLIVTTTDSPIPQTIDTYGAFTRSGGRQLDSALGMSGAGGGGGGGGGGGSGKVSNPPAIRKMINIQER